MKTIDIPDPRAIFPNEYKTSCFIKNVVKAPNIFIGDYTYYDDAVAATDFEKNNVLFNWARIRGISSLSENSARLRRA